VVARHLAQRLSDRWRQGVIVENQPAAGLTIGTAMAAKAAPDGYTLLLGDRTSLAAAPSLYKDLRYDPVKDLRPITLVARAPAILAVHPKVPVANLKEFIEFARRQPDPVLFASAGNATFPHMTGLLFAQLADIRIQPVQFRGGGEAAKALLGGHVVFTALAMPAILSQVNAGQAKALAVTSKHRMPGAPDIPTAAEAGLSGLESEQWVGMLVPAGTPDAITDEIGRRIVEILRDSDMGDKLRAQGAEPAPGTPTEFAAFMASETLRLKRLIETANLRVD
jgi:tripartite-type tricarboxylate transporter receptor subunit TctC